MIKYILSALYIKYINNITLCEIVLGATKMTRLELLAMLDYFDKFDLWAFKLKQIKMFFDKESKQSIQMSLNRHTRDGLIVRCAKGVYANPRGEKPAWRLEYLAGVLRNYKTFYLSLETLLSEHSLISQIPNRLTFVSQGRSQTFYTPYGIIEFTHTSTNHKNFLKDCYFDSDRKIYIANPEKAINDIYRHNRSVDLYEEQLAKDSR